jgi:hypothetical protein
VGLARAISRGAVVGDFFKVGALTVGGGLTMIAFNMIVLPALYLKYGRAPARRAREEPAMGAPALPE